ncbi:hypothetical protein SPRA44_740042 [Serratia proteamaculans]|nr:hypothetical protein SPRA44_740042 [Serratia proteamaculans]
MSIPVAVIGALMYVGLGWKEMTGPQYLGYVNLTILGAGGGGYFGDPVCQKVVTEGQRQAACQNLRVDPGFDRHQLVRHGQKGR